ncbi:MAG: amidohydrolase [Peptococcaceae bacterium]|nr:amidohydrolase [Peptococcaceae bacterium]
MKKLVKNAYILTMERQADGSLRQPFLGEILIDGDSITAVKEALSASEANGAEIIDGRNTLVMPGLINTHSHGAMSLLRGYGDDLPLNTWLFDRVFPVEDKMTAEDVYWGGLLSICEMIRSGTTCFADMYFFSDAFAEAVKESGIRANISRCVDHSAAKLKESCDFYTKWQGAAAGRITACLAPHSPYLCPPDFLQEIAQEAKRLGTFLNIHLAETAGEQADYLKTYGKREVEKLAEIGFFDVPVLGAHLVHVSEAEMQLLAEHQVVVAHDPRSNLKLGNGVAPVAEMLEKNILVSIGTDSPCSNNNLDMFQELRTVALLQKGITANPTVLPADEVLTCATVNGAKALQLEREIGTLSPGKKADMIFVDLDKPHMQPGHDKISDLVYAASGSDVKAVLVNGELLMKDYQLLTIDEKLVMAKAAQAAKRLTAQ